MQMLTLRIEQPHNRPLASNRGKCSQSEIDALNPGLNAEPEVAGAPVEPAKTDGANALGDLG